ncbi:MAG: AsmA family protein [Acidobacteriota bacterium]
MSDDSKKKFGGLKIAIIVVVVLVIGLIALPFFIDVNKFKPEIESRLSSALGREVKTGNLGLSLFSGSLAVEDISIADNPNFSSAPFLQAKSLKVGVEMMPLLLSKELRITEISLDGPSINLIRSADGRWNFSGLGSGKNNGSGNANKSKENPGGGISEDSFVNKKPAVSDDRITIDQGGNPTANSNTGGAKTSNENPGGGISEDSIVIKKLAISDGRITIDRGGKPTTYSGVDISASNLSFTTAFPVRLSALLPGGGDLLMEGKAGPMNRQDTAKTPLEADITVNNFDLVESGFVSPDAGMSGVVDFDGVLTSDGRNVESRGSANADRLQVVKGGSPASRNITIDYAVDYSLANQRGSLNSARITFGKAVAELTGAFRKQGEDLALNMKLIGTGMPVDDVKGLLPAFGVVLPKGASLEGGVVNTNMTATGPVDALTIAGSSDVSNSRLAGFDLAGKMAVLNNLTGIQSDSETLIETLASSVRATPQGIRVSDIKLVVPAIGELSGDGTVSPEQALNFKMKALVKASGSVGSALSQLVRGRVGSGQMTIPFFVRGTASEPKFVLDVENAAGSLIKSQLSGQGDGEEKSGTEKAIGDALKNLFGD